MSVVVSNLTKIYGDQKAINSISFEASKGEILGFLGPNGAGKTTTMKIISCFMPASSGEVTVCGYDVTKHPLEVKKSIGYLAEHNPLYDDMYIMEYLQFVASIHGIKNISARVEEMIEMTGLHTERHKQISMLSKGYRQRVGLAQAMIHDPEVLILDEPTSGLDPNQLIEIRQLIKNIAKDKTVIFSSHIMQEIQHLCDRVIILKRGRLVANDEINLLKDQVNSKVILNVEFLKVVDLSNFDHLEGVNSIVKISDTCYEFKSDRGIDIREQVFDSAVANGYKILEMQRQEISIEDVFQTLTS